MAKLGSLNLANHSDAERQAVSADRLACLLAWKEAKRLAEQKASKGRGWREWVKRELAGMDNSEQVRKCLNKRLGV